MRVALITPYSFPENRGNAVTVRRIARNLSHIGVEVELFGLDVMRREEIVYRVGSGNFDLCHAFHACDGGAVARQAAMEATIPFIITLTGSDLYEAFRDHRKEIVIDSLRDAAAVVAFHDSIRTHLEVEMPELADKLCTIPQGVEIPPDSALKPPDGEFIFLLPAGLRPVKDVLFPLELLSKLSKKEPSVRFVITGPALDREYAAKVTNQIRDYPFASYSGALDHQEMIGMYQRADAVINSSLSEGGMANSLLEAMAAKRPVLVSNIEGNRSLVTDGINGLVYSDAENFVEKAGLLICDGELRLKLIETAFQEIVAEHDPRQEALRYLEIYKKQIPPGTG